MTYSIVTSFSSKSKEINGCRSLKKGPILRIQGMVALAMLFAYINVGSIGLMRADAHVLFAVTHYCLFQIPIVLSNWNFP